MNKPYLLLTIIFLAFHSKAQKLNIQVSLKDKTSFSGRLIEYKEGDYLVVDMAGNPVKINFNTISTISSNSPNSSSSKKDSVPKKSQEPIVGPIKKVAFQSNNELTLGLGIGTINGPSIYGKSPNNTDIFPGIYSANGVLFGQCVFAGIGVGLNFHSDKRGFSVPAALDIRWRILRKKKISPIILAQGGMEYSNGSAGTLFLTEGIGFSSKINQKISIHLILNHSFMATSRELLPSGTDRNSFVALEYNYLGIKVGVGF